jgi:hypothetical protein
MLKLKDIAFLLMQKIWGLGQLYLGLFIHLFIVT